MYDSTPKPAAERQAMSISDFSKLFSIGRTKVYEEIRTGRLKAKKHGRRTLILMDEAQRWLRSLDDLSCHECER